MFRLERFDRVQITGDCGRRGQLREIEHQQFLGVVPHPERVIHHQRCLFQTVKQMGRGDVMHVERRILPQPDHVEIRQINLALRPQGGVIALHPLHGQIMTPRGYAPLLIGEVIGGVVEQRVPARLCFLGQAKAAVRVDVHVPDRVHLKGDFHKGSPCCSFLDGAAGRGVQWVSRARRRFQGYAGHRFDRPTPRQTAHPSARLWVRRQ